MPLNSLLFFNILWIAVAVFAPKNSTAASSITNYTILSKPDCESKCGNLTVPYPFGIGSACAFDSTFEINCSTASSPPKAFLSTTNLEVTDISDTEVRIKNWVASGCYNRTGGLIPSKSYFVQLSLESLPFTFSDLNMFTVIGCGDMAVLTGTKERNFTKACASLCYSSKDVVQGDCSGLGCCQISIPKGTKAFETSLESWDDRKEIWYFNPCAYSFVGEATRFRFGGARDLLDKNFVNKTEDTVPMVLDWAIGNLSCAQAWASNTYVCQQNSVCNDSDSGLGGYTCSCMDGYEGNPYLSGCHDIDECKDRNKNPCGANSICKNNPGNYSCSCKPGYYNPKGQRVCIDKNSVVIKLSLGMSFGFLCLLIGISWLYFINKRRNLLNAPRFSRENQK